MLIVRACKRVCANCTTVGNVQAIGAAISRAANHRRHPARAARKKARSNEVSLQKTQPSDLLVLPVRAGVGQYPAIIFYDVPGAGRPRKETCKVWPVFRH
jgi:hypothetical protein